MFNNMTLIFVCLFIRMANAHNYAIFYFQTQNGYFINDTRVLCITCMEFFPHIYFRLYKLRAKMVFSVDAKNSSIFVRKRRQHYHGSSE